ncbi:MAG TPA: S8 family serine peptidase [Rugosimonospora sp.]
MSSTVRPRAGIRHLRRAAGIWPHRRAAVAAIVTALAVGATAVGQPAHAGSPGASGAAGRPGYALPPAAQTTPTALTGPAVDDVTGTVTLVTGDQVTLARGEAGTPAVTFLPAAGREGMPFLQRIENGHVTVTPFDAQRLVATNVLDSALFDVTALLSTPRSTGQLPLIVTYGSDAAAAAAAPRLRAGGTRVERDLPSVHSKAVDVPAASASAFWKAVDPAAPRQADSLTGGITQVSLDGVAQLDDVDSDRQIGAPQVWQRGLTGAGATVAVLDTGYDPTHPDLAGRVVEAKDFTDSPNGTKDDVGHGTHVATIIAGGGRSSGVAPGAKLLIGRVCTTSGCPDSAIIAGMEWAAAAGAKVVNLSLGGAATDGTDVMSQALNTLTAQYGTLFVVAAGNNGRDESVTAPGTADAALTVGAVTGDDQLASFSSRGPRVGDHAVKPEITAPGYAIVAGRAAGTTIGYPIDDRYIQASGTSMAAPHVAGAAAILAAAHPDWTAERLKSALVGAAQPQSGATVYGQGSGRLDLARAASQQVYAVQPTLTLGPFTVGDSPASGTITYRNDGPHAVTVKLDIAATDLAGREAPRGTFALSAKHVTVPAGGTAQVTVTAQAAGPYGARVTATGDGAVVQTPVSAYANPVTHPITVSTVDRDGVTNGTSYGFPVMLTNLDTQVTYTGVTIGRPLSAQLPAGRYAVYAWIPTLSPDRGPAYPSFTVVAQAVTLDTARNVVLDARPGERVGVNLNAVETGTYTGFALGVAGGGTAFALGATEGYVVPADVPGLAYTSVQYLRDVPGSTACGPGSGSVCNVAVASQRGPVSSHPVITDADLATVTADFGSTGTAGTGDRTDFAVAPGSSAPPADGIITDEFTLPGQLTSHFYSVGGVQWSAVLFQTAPKFLQVQSQGARTIANGATVHDDWYTSVLGPAIGGSSVRSGNVLTVSVPLASDSSPGHVASSGWIGGVGETVLYRDNRLVTGGLQPDSASFQVSPDKSQYRLVSSTTMAGATRSTRVAATWTFESRYTAEPEALPLLAVRFSPRLDGYGRLPAGQTVRIPVRVDGTATTGRVRELTVEVSFDDGLTWVPVPVRDGFATVQHPAAAGFVSLRASARDVHGNSIDQTIIRAYQLS